MFPQCFKHLATANPERIGKDVAAALLPDLQDLQTKSAQLQGQCVPLLETSARDNYTRLVATVDGLVALAAGISRSNSGIFQELYNGPTPILSLIDRCL